MLSSMLIARSISTDSYSHYAFALMISKMLAQILLFGCGGVLVREYGAESDPLRIRSVRQVYNRLFYFGLPLAFIISFTLMLLNSQDQLFSAVFLLTILFYISSMQQSYYVAIGRVIQANFIQLGMMIVIFSVGLQVWMSQAFTHTSLGLLLALPAVWLALILGRFYSFGVFSTKTSPVSHVSFALSSVGVMFMTQLEIIVLRLIGLKSKIGFYTVALTITSLLWFIASAITSNIISKVSTDYYALDMPRFQKKINNYTRLIIFINTGVAVFLAISAKYIFLLYGVEYMEVSYPLCLILMAGFFIDILCGPVAPIMNIVGLEREVSKSYYFMIVVGGAWAFLLCYRYGLIGAAISAALTLSLWNIYLSIILYKKRGISSSFIIERMFSIRGPD